MNNNNAAHRWIALGAILAVAIGAATAGGCSYQAGVFSSDGDGSGDGEGGSGTGTGSTGTGEGACNGWGAGGSGYGSGPSDLPPSQAERIIAEADIVQIADDRLYALSRTAGLSVIDVSVRDQLTLLDQVELEGYPLEMVLRGELVYLMIDYGVDVHLSCVQALNASVPTDIQPLGPCIELPGHLSDTRIVGDVLYAISYETHDCPTCPSLPTTTITSLSLSAPSYLEQVDQLSYEQPYADDIGWKRSVTVTAQRMYVAGVEWDGIADEGHSTIHVVDISDPSGALVEGASVEATGQILSRWQMDEHDGVLRVLSQPGVWSDEGLPTVQTFSVVSSQQLEPLGSLELELSVPESLRAVRFDGERAYAITAQALEPYDPTPGAEVDPPEPPWDSCGPECDPLFVIDLSDPAEPEQLGALEMPGWIYHLEPRGDRLLAIGFESTYPLGELSVSLFDVADGADPQMLARVGFGNQWSGLSEDQNRIHKAFSIIDELGLIAVPYGWWVWFSEVWCDEGPCGTECWDDGFWERSGAVQLIDYTGDTLVERGSAQLGSWALRARIHDPGFRSVGT